MRDDSFCIFMVYGKQVKILGIGRVAELVASKLTQITTNAIKIK